MAKKKEVVFVLVILVIFISACFSSAMIQPGTPFFNLSQASFGPGQVLEGTLNFSLDREPSNTIVRGQVVQIKEMNLLEFLRKANANFVCEPADCNITFTAFNPQETKILNLVKGSEVYFGLVAYGSAVEIKNLSFMMFGSSAADPVCYETPFKFDLLDDSIIDFEYKLAPANGWCPEHASECFDYGYAVEEGSVEIIPSCQKIWLNKTGKVNVTALLNRQTYPGDEPEIEFFITDLSGLLKGNCTMYGWEISEEYSKVGCVIGEIYGEPTDFYIEEPGYYYVCVRKIPGAYGGYTIKKESQPDVCGFYASPPSPVFTEDYAIYVSEGKFAPFNGEAYFNETTMLGTTPLMVYVQNYINSKYGGNCSLGCIIPLKFISLAEQQVTLTEPVLKYTPSPGASPTFNNNFYDLTVNWPRINMTLQQIPFSVLNLTAPETSTYYTVIARVGSVSGSAQFKIEPVPKIQSVAPLIVIPGQTTMFRVIATAPAGRQIIEYRWDFGDNTAEQITTEPNITHTYTEIGTYTLTVKAKDNLGLIGSRSFTLTSNITKELLNNTLHALRVRLNAFILQLNAVEYWYRDMIAINTTVINTTLDTLETQLAVATQTQLLDIKNELDSLNSQIPKSINDTLILRDSPYIPSPEAIRPSYVADLSKESYDPGLKTQYQDAIALWQENHADLKISGIIKSLVYDGTEDKVSVVNLKIDPLASISEVYVVFLLPGVSYSNVRIMSNADEVSDLSDAVGFTYHDLSSIETISIALPGKHDFSELVFYASPQLQDLGITPQPPPGPPPAPPYTLAIILIIAIILAVLVALWFIWKGKKKKKLFENPMDLYNITQFISSNQAAGMSKKKIIEQLKKAGWSKKQIDYAFKKVKQKPIFMARGPTSLRRF